VFDVIIIIVAEEEECVTIQILKQPESPTHTKNRICELNKSFDLHL